MSRTVIGTALSAALLATAACSGSSPSTPSASLSAAPPSATAFSAQPPAATGVQPGSLSGLSAHNHSDEGHGRESQLEGAIVSVDTTHHSFVVRTTTVNVTDTTIIRHGHTRLPFADLKAGEQVHVKGTPDGTAITAREVKVQTGDHDAGEGEAEGVVSDLAHACPSVTFTIGTLKVATDPSTRFRGGDCAAVVNGVSVEIRGTIQSDGSLLASRVSLAHEEDGEED